MPTWRFTNRSQANAPFWPTLDSIDLSDGRPCALGTFSGQIIGSDDLAEEDEVWVEYAEDDVTYIKLFAGDVSVLVDAHSEPGGTPAIYRFNAQDYTARLDWTVIDDGFREVEESATARVAWIMGNAPSHGLTASGVDSIGTLIAPYDYTGMTRREALQQVASIVGAYFYVDSDKDLQFFITRVEAAPFAVSTPSSPPTSYPYRFFTLERDATVRADEVMVQGEDIVIWRPDGAPAGGSQRQAAISDGGIKTNATGVLRGDRELVRIGTPQLSGSLEIMQPGLRAMHTVRIVNPTHAIDADFIISAVRLKPIDPNPTEVGGGGGRAFFDITFADRLVCEPTPSSNDLARAGTDIADDCTKAVAIVGDPYDFDGTGKITMGWGRNQGVYVNVNGKLYKFSTSMTQKWSLATGDFIWDHVPDDGNRVPRPVPVHTRWGPYNRHGASFIYNHGSLAYSLGPGGLIDDDNIWGIAAQDRARYWVSVQHEDDTTTLSVRDALTGAVITYLDFGDLSHMQLRSTPSGQHVAVTDWTGGSNVVRVYDRALNLVKTITLDGTGIPVGFDATSGGDDWMIDDAFDLYALQGYSNLIKFDGDSGLYIWAVDLYDSHTFRQGDNSISDGSAPSTLFLDRGSVLLAGQTEYGVANDHEAALVSVNSDTGAVTAVSKFGAGDGSGDHEANAVIRATKDGCLFLAGWSDSNATDFEDMALDSSDTPWLMRLGSMPGGGGATLNDGGPPTGAAGGVLSGTFPNPAFAADMATQAELDAHAGAADPHTGYQKESEKGAANGYAGLDAGALVPVAQLGTGTPTGAKFLRDDQTYAVPSGVMGTSFPGSPSTNDRFFRTDLGLEFFYNGTRWLSSQLFTQSFTNPTNLIPLTATPSDAFFAPVYPSPGSNIWLEKHITQFFVNGGTALSGSHKWVGTFDKRPTNNVAELVITTNINSGSSSVWRSDSQDINALLGTTYFVFSSSWTQTGTPGSLYSVEMWTYRIVAA